MTRRWIAAVAVLVVSVAVRAEDSGGLRWSPVPTTGAPAHVGIGGYAVVVHDERHERVLVLSDTMLWSLDLRRGAWSLSQRLVLPDGVTEAAYDTARDWLVLWNGGVGDVYTWRDGDPALTRVDGSLPHRTQFGHAGVLHPRTGDVYAFGGYGFWYYRNLITRYERATGEWFLVPLAAGSPQPTPRTEALATYWEAGDALFVLGGVTGAREDGRQEPGAATLTLARDLWRYDYTSARWTRLALLPEALAVGRRYPAAEPPTGGNLGAFSAQDTTRALWFVAGRHTFQGGTASQSEADLLVVDLRSGQVGRLGTIGSSSETPAGVVWDAPRRRLVVLRYAMTTNRLARPVTVYAASADAALVAASLERPGSGRSVVFTGLGLLVLVGGAVSWLLRLAGGTRQPVALAESGSHDARAVILSGEGTIRLDGVELPEAEERLLGLLARARYAGEPFIPADVIEAALWPDLDGPDYVRKVRNQTMRRLATRLATHRVSTEEAIVSRRALDDRRRVEYALGEAIPLVFVEGRADTPPAAPMLA